MGNKLTLTMLQVANAARGAAELIQRYKKELCNAAALRVIRLKNQLEPEARIYWQRRNDLIEAHGVEGEGGVLSVPPNTRAAAAFARAELDLDNQETHLPISRLRLEELGLERVDADVLDLIWAVLDVTTEEEPAPAE